MFLDGRHCWMDGYYLFTILTNKSIQVYVSLLIHQLVMLYLHCDGHRARHSIDGEIDADIVV